MSGKTYCIDIDDTILYSEFDPDSEYQYKLIGKNNKLIKKINELYDNGDIIIIQTGRHWGHLETTKEQLAIVGVKYHTLTLGKPYADYYIDDKGITPEDFLDFCSHGAV